MLKKIEISKDFLYLGFCCYLVSLVYGTAAIDNCDLFRKIGSIISVVFLCASILLSKRVSYHLKESYLYCFLLLLLLQAVFSYDFLILILLLIYFAIDRFSIDLIFKLSFISLTLITILIVLLSFCGITENILLERYSTFGIVVRNSFGFQWALCLPDIVVYLSMYLCIGKKNFFFKDFLIFEFLSVLLYLLCDSKNAIVSMQLVVIGFFFVKLFNSSFYRKLLYLVSIFIFPVLTFISYYILYLYINHESSGLMLNDLLTGRLNLTDLNMNLYPMKILNITDSDSMKNIAVHTIDSGYFYLGFRYGLWVYLFYWALCYLISKYFWQVKNYYGMTSIIVVLLMSFIDNNFIGYGFLPFYVVALYSFKLFLNKYARRAKN